MAAQAAMTIPIRSMPELVAALRARRDELQLTHETLDSIAGWPAGYASKLLAPEPIKNLGWQSLGLGLGALGIALVVVPDEEQANRVRSRWTPRERPQRTTLRITLGIENEVPVNLPITADLQQQLKDPEFMRSIGKKGGKRRMKTMSARARQRSAAHAARIRWSKREVSHA